MKAKTIKAVIAKKMNEWWESIQDESLRELVKKNTIVTGGSIASMLIREKVSDFDVYFRDRETTLAIANHYVARFQARQKEQKGIECPLFVEASEDRIKIVVKSAGIASETRAGAYVGEVMQDPGAIEDAYEETEQAVLEQEDDKQDCRPIFLSTNAVTLSGKIQVVLRFYGEPDEIHKNYDFVHCTNYWTSWDKELVLHKAALESLLARELRYVGSKYPVCSIFRTRKFISRGWTINAGQMLKICMQVSALDLTDIKVLEDQLTGVDVAYFIEVVEKLKAKDPAKVDTAYLVEILDRMF